MKMYFFIIVIIALLLFSCNKQKDDRKSVTLFLNMESSQYTDDRFLIDSIHVEYGDSIFITRYIGNYEFESRYYREANGVYEIRERCSEELECFGTDTILTFYKSDTTFIYDSVYGFISIVFQYTLADSRYEIRKNKDEFITIKQSRIDSTYKEIFFYDENYNIYKFVNTWNENKCVYVRKEECIKSFNGIH